jgi:serine/threonine-protein kinase ATR
LVKLIDYLGHKNLIAPATAFNEVGVPSIVLVDTCSPAGKILGLARFRRTNPKQLLRPYWRILAFSAIKDFTTRPRTARLLAELLELPPVDFILLIHSHALPYLVLHKKTDVIDKIAEISGKQTWEVCLDKENLAPILAALLVQETPDVPGQSKELLRQISSHFDAADMVELVRVEPVMTALELLKAAADSEDSRKPHVSCARDRIGI